MKLASERNTLLAVALLAALIAVMFVGMTEASSSKSNQVKSTPSQEYAKQLLTDPESRETDPPNFVRLVVMRLIYGIAAQMGVEDRLSGVLNGIFVPPNADDDDDYGGFADDLGDGGDFFDI